MMRSPPEPGRRLDQALVARGLAASRTRAAALIEAGAVTVDGIAASKPGRTVDDGARIAVEPGHDGDVSRGAVKLRAALDRFGLDPAGLVALDIGASTGGFTQVLLERGAERVYAVDVGHDQLAPSLAADPRVIVRDGVNARHLDGSHVPEPPHVVTCDASFIGLELVLPPALDLAAPGASLVALVKPQFEVGREHIGKGGIVRDAAAIETACRRIAAWLGQRPGWTLLGLIESPITGGDGNREFLACARRTG